MCIAENVSKKVSGLPVFKVLVKRKKHNRKQTGKRDARLYHVNILYMIRVC